MIQVGLGEEVHFPRLGKIASQAGVHPAFEIVNSQFFHLPQQQPEEIDKECSFAAASFSTNGEQEKTRRTLARIIIRRLILSIHLTLA
jgi:hypothetical protein